jgi:hypothetical protein
VHAGQTWPPQPPGITHVVVHSDPALEAAERRRARRHLRRLVHRAEADPTIGAMLGRRFTPVGIREPDPPAGCSALFFSHAHNMAIDVQYDAHDVPRAVTAMPAVEAQPEIMPDEIHAATRIARRFFRRRGRDLRDREGFGILAYHPDGSGRYDTRVLYVSFHANADAPPDAAAWVDLTRRTVLNFREEP